MQFKWTMVEKPKRDLCNNNIDWMRCLNVKIMIKEKIHFKYDVEYFIEKNDLFAKPKRKKINEKK